MEKQRGRKKERQRDREAKRKVTKLERKESSEGRGKEGKKETKGQANSERTREEGEGAISQGGPPSRLPPSLQGQLRNGRHEAEAATAKSLGNLGDESQGDGH